MSTTLAKDFWINLKYWVRKHRRAVVLSVAAGVGGYYAYRYYRSLAQEQLAKEGKRKDAEEHAELQLQHHFESIQKIADATTLPSVLPHLKDQLFTLVDLSVLTEKLMAGKGQAAMLGHKEKIEIWEELKVLSFTRTVSAVFSVALLDVFLRTQLNILGRRVYLETARDSSGDVLPELQSRLTKACQHRFVGLVDYLPYTGLKDLVIDVQKATEQVVGRRELRDKVQLVELGNIFQEVRQQLESQEVLWGKYVLPANNSISFPAMSSDAEERWETEDEENLAALMDETRGILNSSDFANVLSAALDCLFTDMQSELRLALQEGPDDGVPLAKLLPHVAGVGNALLESIDDNKYVRSIAELSEVQAFCAAVYAGGRSLEREQ